MPPNSTDPDRVAEQARHRLEADGETRVAAVRHVADAARTAAAAHSAAWATALSAD